MAKLRHGCYFVLVLWGPLCVTRGHNAATSTTCCWFSLVKSGCTGCMLLILLCSNCCVIVEDFFRVVFSFVLVRAQRGLDTCVASDLNFGGFTGFACFAILAQLKMRNSHCVDSERRVFCVIMIKKYPRSQVGVICDRGCGFDIF